MNSKTREITITAIFTAIIILLGMTPYGLIPLGFINLTIVHIPVIVGALCLKRKSSIILGVAFGAVSTFAAFGMSLAAQSGLAALLLSYSPLAVIAMCMIPRIMIPIMTKITYDGLFKVLQADDYPKRRGVAITVSAIVGSLTNTVLYLGMMGMFFSMYGIGERFTAIFSATLAIGASCEAVASALIANAVVPIVSRSQKHKFELTSEVNTSELPKSDEADDISSVDEVSVAVIPATDSLLPELDEANMRKLDRCKKYLYDDNIVMADSAFDAFISHFRSDNDIFGASVYSIMQFIEMSKYKTAADRLCRFLKSDVAEITMSSDNKQILTGIMSIIHTSVVNDAQNPVFAAAIEKDFKEATDLVAAEKTKEASQAFQTYIKEIGAKDRTIKREVRIEPKYDEEAARASVRELTGDDTGEGISESNLAVMPTAASVVLPEGIKFDAALDALSDGRDAEAMFESIVSGIETEKVRAEADKFVMLTYFEKNDYAHALNALYRMLKRNYSDGVLSEESIKATVKGILTIGHSILRTAVPGKKEAADRTMEKIKAFYDKGMYMLCAQLLEKYFLATGLAIHN